MVLFQQKDQCVIMVNASEYCFALIVCSKRENTINLYIVEDNLIDSTIIRELSNVYNYIM